ncbi:MAG: 2-oxoglutarate dehydrogenase, E2 component, dihydrolipoamide succinyltransferase [Bacteroidetes bacterium]|nr:2-oxoglutarate dehydrogenase, E2 component, dihydrolipoamide succinyltransferase [bacterium]NBP65124.1 2-oxoglutarate dehydrogenase, E2 component, dihydrolipoamide succinyltransferase [Bacteroidota bacterium]
MKVDVVMPKMGESIQEGKILRWLKKPGDKVERDEILLEISTDKVDTEVPSPSAGILTAILAQENDTVEVGKIIAELNTDAQASVAAPPPTAPSPAPAPQPTPAPVQAAAPSATGNQTDVVMPKMGESIQEGKILRWLKKPGDSVERDEILLEISTDKVDTEVPSPVAGTLTELLAAEGDTVEVGAVIARLGSSGATVQSSPSIAPTPTQSIPVQSAPAPTPIQVAPVHNEQSAPITSIPRTSGSRFYSPLVRTIAEAEGISLQELDAISGTGMEGRVTKNDILTYIGKRGSTSQTTVQSIPTPAPIIATPTSTAAPAPAPVQTYVAKPADSTTLAQWGQDVEVIPMDRVRQIIADHMVRSKQTSPHVTSVGEADVTQLVNFREKHKASFEQKEGFKLTLTPFFAKAIIDAVKQFPLVNVSVDGSNIIRHKKINLSFATVLNDGNLIVPVIKNSDMMNLGGISRSINDLALRARGKKLSPDEISGGTISMTNMGAWGSLFGTPVINQPQTAIIGIYAVQKRPVVREVNGEDLIAIRQMMYVSITYDHRVIDGVLASSCLRAIVQNLEKMNESSIEL